MDDSKKKMVMFGVLALVVVGAGASYFVFSDSKGAQATAKNGPLVKKERAQPKETTKRAVPVAERSAATENAPIEKRVRDTDEDEEEALIKKQRASKEQPIKKKKKRVPAA